MTPIPIRALLLLVCALSVGTASLWVDTNGQWRHLVWIAPAAIAPGLQPPASLTPAAASNPPPLYTSVLDRPVFAPDRRPPPPPAPPAPPPPPDPLADIKLYGVFSGDVAGVIARVEGKMRRVKINDTLGEWTLKQVDDRTVTFTKGDEKRELKLAYAPLGAPAAAPAGRPAAGQPPGANPAATPSAAAQNLQDEIRDTLRRRNELRAAKGLPMLTQ